MKRIIVTALTAVVAVVSVAACTPREVAIWKDWHAKDPVAAERFARNLNNTSSGSSSGAQIGNCASYNFAAYGLPTSTFRAIAYRESGCDWTVRVVDWNDTGGGLLGFNFKGSLAGYWYDLCGLTWGNLTSSLDRQMRCAAAAYRQLGLEPWQ